MKKKIYPYVLNEQVDEFTDDSKNTSLNNDLVCLAQKNCFPHLKLLSRRSNSKNFIHEELRNLVLICTGLWNTAGEVNRTFIFNPSRIKIFKSPKVFSSSDIST